MSKTFFLTHQKCTLFFIQGRVRLLIVNNKEESLETVKSEQNRWYPARVLQRTLTTKLHLFITPFHYIGSRRNRCQVKLCKNPLVTSLAD